MAEAIIVPLVSKLQEVAVKEAKALAAVGGEIDKLRDKLLWLHALVHEADLRSRHDGSRLVRVLAFQIRDAGFDVEDAVDLFYLRGSLRRRFGRHNWWRISKEFIFNVHNHVFVRAILSRRIRSINVRLDEIIGNNSTYTLSQTDRGDGKTWRASQAIPPLRKDWDWDYSKEFELKCHTTVKDNLMDKINNNRTDSEVISLVGVEGVGKTALLWHVYKQQTMMKEFDVCIWLSFLPDISDESMLQQMKQQLDNKTRGKTRREDAANKFRCLVIIDSPVSSTTWPKVEKKILEMVREGSKIVLSVGSSWHEENITQDTDHGTIRLRRLDEAHSRTLFNHVYGLGGKRGTNYATEEMNHIRNKILKITNGLPLAVVLLAKLMRTMDFGKWEAAAAYLECNSEDNKLKTIVSVCIDDLPDELKSCLLYTAGFPESRPIDARQLVRLWMAEGFLTRQHKMEAEQLGQCYLKELIYRGLLQLINKTSAHGGYVLWVAIPDQIHSLLRSEAQRTSFMDVHYGGSLPPPGNTRRLALHNYNDKFPALHNRMDKLRTVVSYSDEYTDYPYGHMQEKSSKDEPEPELVIREFLNNSPYLRVINLEGIKVVKRKKKNHAALPHEIGEMVHLQYLGVRCRWLKKVPSSIGNLRNLQTIDVRGTHVTELPESLWKVKTLRHVLGDGLAFPRSSTVVGDDLKLMHTLESVTIDHASWKRLLRFRFLHRLHVAKLKESQGEDLASVLGGLSFLEALILSGEKIPMDLFAKASEATTSRSRMKRMEYLMLDGPLHLQDASNKKLVDYPCVQSCLVDVTHLVLRSTNVGKKFISWIGKLPVLAELELLEDSYKYEKLTFGTDEFNSLMVLRISGLDTLHEIFVSDATTSRKIRNKAINMDVPDCVEVVTTSTDQHSPLQQPIIITEEPSSTQQAEGVRPIIIPGSLPEDKHRIIITEIILEAVHKNRSSKTAINKYIKDNYVTKCIDDLGLLANKRRSSNDHSSHGAPADKLSRFAKIFMEAVNQNKSSITSITNYIMDEYVAKCLDEMVLSDKLDKKKSGRYYKYVIINPTEPRRQETS